MQLRIIKVYILSFLILINSILMPITVNANPFFSQVSGSDINDSHNRGVITSGVNSDNTHDVNDASVDESSLYENSKPSTEVQEHDFNYQDESKSTNQELATHVKLSLSNSNNNSMGSRELIANSWRYKDGQLINPDVDTEAISPLSNNETARGIDVSSWQGEIDWKKVKDSGIDFAIIRIGWGDLIHGGTDSHWLQNVTECERLGIPWGGYLYSYATNTKEASDEADRVIEALNNHSPSLPIYYDMEDSSMLTAKNQLEDIANTFCIKVESNGYRAGIYANLYWWKTYLNFDSLNSWDRWVAQYNSSCSYDGDYSLWQYSSNGSVPGISGNVDVNYAYGDYLPSGETSGKPSIKYRSHVSDIGWQTIRMNGTLSGTVGLNKSVEALDVYLSNAPSASSIQIRTYISQLGWQDWQTTSAGTTGESHSIEAVQLKLTGDISADYDLYYRVHSADFGWLGWTMNGNSAGSVGFSKGIQAIEIQLVKKGDQAPGDTVDSFRFSSFSLGYAAHLSQLGWEDNVNNDEIAGTTGQSIPLEALRFVVSSDNPDDYIDCIGHVQDLGWKESTKNFVGTTGESKTLQAVKLSLSKSLSSKYDLYYRVHVSNVGWLSWTSNGSPAGTTGFDYPIEAIQVKIVVKGSQGPSNEDCDSSESYIECPTGVSYLVHSSNLGWLSAVSGGSTAGITGQSIPVEAVSFTLTNQNQSGSIEADSYSQELGWQGWTTSTTGSTGRSASLQIIRLRLSGDIASKYDIWYRVHVSNFGWMDWTCNGSKAGSLGYNYPIEAIQIQLLQKGTQAPGDTNEPFRATEVSFNSHSTNIGWSGLKSDDIGSKVMLGTTGQSLALQAFSLMLPSYQDDSSIVYSSHVSDIGWQSSVSNGQISGTTGKGLPIEAIKISLNGQISEKYDIWYRVHLSNVGWLGWVSNGSPAGSEGLSVPVEAVELCIIKKGSSEAPSDSGNGFLSPASITYSSNVQGVGWQDFVDAPEISGTTGENRSLYGIAVNLNCQNFMGSISYSVHASNVGWLSPVGNGVKTGQEPETIQAIRVNLTGILSQVYDIWYRVHVENLGWLGWTSNGQSAGSTSCNLNVQSIQLCLTRKGSAAPGDTANSFFQSVSDLPYCGYQTPGNLYKVSNKSVTIKNMGFGIFGFRTPSKIPYNATRSDCINAMVNRAIEYLGTPYIWDYACAPGVGVDCAGLVMQSLYACGMDLSPMNPWDHYYTFGHDHYANDIRNSDRFYHVSFNDRQKGDLILTSGHVSIYLGNDQIIEAYSPATGVRLASVYSTTPILAVVRPFP